MTTTLLLHRQVLELHLLHVDMLSLGHTNKNIYLPPGPLLQTPGVLCCDKSRDASLCVKYLLVHVGCWCMSRLGGVTNWQIFQVSWSSATVACCLAERQAPLLPVRSYIVCTENGTRSCRQNRLGCHC